MCGRTACSLCPSSIVKSMRYHPNGNAKSPMKTPKWIQMDKEYKSSYNHAPGQYLPVLLKKSLIASDGKSKNKDDDEEEDNDDDNNESDVKDDRIICPMRWGLIPAWFKGDPKDFQFKTINCRSEGIQEKRTYSVPLNKGKRCVILTEGFFEWKRDASKKHPFFFYFPQNNVSFDDRSWEMHEKQLFKDGDWKGPRLLTIAGLFEVSGDNGLYSFTIITVPAHKNINWVHNRMPAILDGDEQIRDWIDYERVPVNSAVKLLKPMDNLQWHRVTDDVGNTRNNTIDNLLPFKEEEKKPIVPKGQQSLDKFFKKTAKKSPQRSVKKELDSDSDGGGKMEKKRAKRSPPH